MKLTRRGNTLHLVKRVPVRYARVENRKIVYVSLHTDSEALARQKAEAAWGQMVEAWEARLAGDSADAERRIELARELAQIRGYRFMSAREVARLPLGDLLERIEASMGKDGRIDMREADALLGVAPLPKVTVSAALKAFWTLTVDRVRGKSEDQVRRWKSPRKKAIANFIAVIGDKPLDEITASDALFFRQWWNDRIDAEGLAPNTANKDFTHLGNVLRTVNQMKQLGLTLPLSGLALREGKKRQRTAFSDDWIRSRILAPGALATLNTEARCLLLGMINTGYRPSEAAGLLPGHIRLDADIPHISIEAEGRHLKTDYSERIIPLTGISLEAFRECPGGFPRYRDSPALSATINKYMRENGLCETPGHTLYGLRHSFEDRMLAAEIDERIRRDLFGHRLNRERYGKGATLEHKHRLLQSIAL